MLAACSGHSTCLLQQPPLASGAVVDALLLLGLIVPAVLGALWGAPLVAHELESRTSDFAWAQSVMHDERGPFGLATQALVVQPR